MSIKLGQTRVVFLVGEYAVKIGRVRPLRFLGRLVLFLFSQKRRGHFKKKYGEIFWKAAINDIFAGVVANRAEYVYCMTYNDERTMPTLKQFFGGLVIIQPRGTHVSEEDILASPVSLLKNSKEEGSDMSYTTQFCRHPDGRIVLVDYGRKETRKILISFQ